MKPTTKPIQILADDGKPIKPGDVMKHNPHASHIRRLRDTASGGTASQRKDWLAEALAERFVVESTYDNGFCKAISYHMADKPQVTGACIASNLIRAI